MDETVRLRHLASFPEQSPNPIFELDLSGAPTYANPAARKLLEEAGAEGASALLGAGFGGLRAELEGAGGKAVRRDIPLGGLVFAGTFHMAGDPPRVRVYLRDITPQKRAEEDLRSSERELAVRNRINEAFLTVADDDMYTEVLNLVLPYMRSRLGVFGYIDEDGALVVPSMTRHAWDRCRVPGKSFIFPRGTWSDSSWPTAIREKRPVWSNDRSTDVPAGHLPIERHISMPIIHKGEVIGLFQVANRDADYTEENVGQLRSVADQVAPVLHARLERDRREAARDRAAEALRSSELHFRTLTESLPQLVWTCRGDGPCDFLSQQWVDYTGIPAERQLGFGWLEQLHPGDRDRTVAAWNEAVQKNTEFNVEFRIRRRDGEFRWFKTRAVALRDASGRPVKWFGSNTDIEDVKRIQAELERHRDHLEELVKERTVALEAANAELESFSYTVSHDLRAPLRAIDGFSQAVLEEYGDRIDDPGRGYLERVRSASMRMSGLIDDLLKLSRVTMAEMRRERVDLSAMAREILLEMARSEPARRVGTAVLAGQEATGDPELLRVALENLLSNAWKFTSRADKALIEFGAGAEDGRRSFYVRDNGVGFDMKHAGRLFGPFQRLHPDAEFPGTGIGLATVKRIINRHGGKVWARAEPGKGATFHFTLD